MDRSGGEDTCATGAASAYRALAASYRCLAESAISLAEQLEQHRMLAGLAVRRLRMSRRLRHELASIEQLEAALRNVSGRSEVAGD